LNDLAFVAILLAFFVLATLFVKACERIIGPGEDLQAPARPADAEPDRPAA
jgi:hypothetical protein